MTTTETQKTTKEHSIFIGAKPFMNYVTGVIMQFNQGAEEVTIKARGKFIWRAIDVSQVAIHRFLKDQIEIKEVNLDSEDFVNKDEKQVRVSTIDIVLVKK